MMTRNAVICTGLLLAASFAATQEAPAVPFHMPQPDGWRTETIPFPLEFAPDLDYKGIEELRFAPGMFNAEAEDFGSYAFVWWLPEETQISAIRLEKDLKTYFRGLATAVAADREFDPGNPKHDVQIRRQSEEPEVYVGFVQTFDSFVTRDAAFLMLKGVVRHCTSSQRVAVLFTLSPQPESHPIWKDLDTIQDGFRCSR